MFFKKIASNIQVCLRGKRSHALLRNSIISADFASSNSLLIFFLCFIWFCNSRARISWEVRASSLKSTLWHNTQLKNGGVGSQKGMPERCWSWKPEQGWGHSPATAPQAGEALPSPFISNCHRCCRLSGDSKMARNLNDSPHQDRVMPLFLGTVGVRAAGALLVWASLGETRARRLPSHRSRKRRSAWDLPSTFTQVSWGNGQPRFSGIPSGAQLLTAKMRLPSEHPRRGPHLLTRPTNSRSNAAAAQSLPPYL